MLAVVLAAGGCHDLSTVVGIATGSATGAATANPALGFVIGVSVAAGGNFIADYVTRVRTGTEQDVIAETAGALPPGGQAPWAVYHTIPIDNEHGEVRVIDELTTPIAVCKEVVISVIDGDEPSAPREYYSLSVCRDPQGWKWATAEPAVPRWGTL